MGKISAQGSGTNIFDSLLSNKGLENIFITLWDSASSKFVKRTITKARYITPSSECRTIYENGGYLVSGWWGGKNMESGAKPFYNFKSYSTFDAFIKDLVKYETFSSKMTETASYSGTDFYFIPYVYGDGGRSQFEEYPIKFYSTTPNLFTIQKLNLGDVKLGTIKNSLNNVYDEIGQEEKFLKAAFSSLSEALGNTSISNVIWSGNYTPAVNSGTIFKIQVAANTSTSNRTINFVVVEGTGTAETKSTCTYEFVQNGKPAETPLVLSASPSSITRSKEITDTGITISVTSGGVATSALTLTDVSVTYNDDGGKEGSVTVSVGTNNAYYNGSTVVFDVDSAINDIGASSISDITDIEFTFSGGGKTASVSISCAM